MKYFNEQDIEIIESEIDLSAGYLVDRRVIHHDAVTHVEVKEKPGIPISYVVTDTPAYDEVTEQTYIKYSIKILQDEKILESKQALSTYLLNHPMTWIDGNQYAVTQEKQSLLTSQLSLYNIAQAAGVDYELTWNTTGKECEVWTQDNLAALGLAIGAYVKPLVAHQQEIEIAIRACKTKSEIEAVQISYGE